MRNLTPNLTTGYLRISQALMALLLMIDLGFTIAALWYIQPQVWIWSGTAIGLLTLMWLLIDHRIDTVDHRAWLAAQSLHQAHQSSLMPPLRGTGRHAVGYAFRSMPEGFKTSPFIPGQLEEWDHQGDLGEFMISNRTNGGDEGDIMDPWDSNRCRFGENGKDQGGDHG